MNMWSQIVAILLSLMISISVSYGQGTKTPVQKKSDTKKLRPDAARQAKVPAPEVVNLLPRMKKTALRKGRNVIHTADTGAKIIAIVRENSVVGYDVVDLDSKPLPFTIIPDPFQEERARKMREGMERAARNAAELERCRKLLGWEVEEKGCWIAYVMTICPGDGGTCHDHTGMAYVRCPKGG